MDCSYKNVPFGYIISFDVNLCWVVILEPFSDSFISVSFVVCWIIFGVPKQRK